MHSVNCNSVYLESELVARQLFTRGTNSVVHLQREPVQYKPNSFKPVHYHCTALLLMSIADSIQLYGMSIHTDLHCCRCCNKDCRKVHREANISSWVPSAALAAYNTHKATFILIARSRFIAHNNMPNKVARSEGCSGTSILLKATVDFSVEFLWLEPNHIYNTLQFIANLYNASILQSFLTKQGAILMPNIMEVREKRSVVCLTHLLWMEIGEGAGLASWDSTQRLCSQMHECTNYNRF